MDTFIPSKEVYFNFTKATISAINYTIDKYGKYPWFNGVLKDTVIDLYSSKSKKLMSNPIIMYHTNGKFIGYQGYHYLIWKIEKYAKLYTENIYFYYIQLLLCVFLILICIYFFLTNVLYV